MQKILINLYNLLHKAKFLPKSYSNCLLHVMLVTQHRKLIEHQLISPEHCITVHIIYGVQATRQVSSTEVPRKEQEHEQCLSIFRSIFSAKIKMIFIKQNLNLDYIEHIYNYVN